MVCAHSSVHNYASSCDYVIVYEQVWAYTAAAVLLMSCIVAAVAIWCLELPVALLEYDTSFRVRRNVRL
jgi:hypothetical protein